LIGTAYIAISFVLYLLVRNIRRPFSPAFIAFDLFIGLCGITHFMKIWTVWHPHYLLDGLVKLVTAAASVATAIGLLYVRPQIERTVAAARLSEERRVELEHAHTELKALYRKVKEQLTVSSFLLIVFILEQRMSCSHIVVIEDDANLRETLKDLLEMEGFRVVTASNGKEGLRQIEQNGQPCLILLDLMMPVIMAGNS